jgi:hypothetical protein
MRLKLEAPLVAILLALAYPAAAQVSRTPTPKPKPDAAIPIIKQPMIFYLAKGDADACGAGCSEWIAAEGHFDPAAAQRFNSFLARLRGRKLPIFFHSPGGLAAQAFEIGRVLQKRQMTAGVSRTIPAGCIGANEETCRRLKHSGQTFGARMRHVPPGARLGVHSGKAIRVMKYADGRVRFVASGSPSRDEANAAEQAGKVERYLKEMGISTRLFELISRVPYEQLHFLSRDEIAEFGIDGRDLLETRWTALDVPSQPFIVVLKFVVEAKGAGHKEYRTRMLRLACAGSDRVTIGYYRKVAADEVRAERSVKLALKDRQISFPLNGYVSKIDAIDTGASFNIRVTHAPFEVFQGAAAHGSLEIIESDPAGSVESLEVTKISTSGLSKALEQLRTRCAGSGVQMRQGSKPDGGDAGRGRGVASGR